MRSAKVYLAMKMLLRSYEATAMAFHIRTLAPTRGRRTTSTPCFATSEFQLENMVAKCQSHLNMLLSEMLLQYAYRRPSMLGDFSVDTYNNTSVVQHCEGPWNAWGDERRVPYILIDHRERKVRRIRRRESGPLPASCTPADEPVTMWQVDVLTKEVMVHTGTSVPMFSEHAGVSRPFLRDDVTDQDRGVGRRQESDAVHLPRQVRRAPLCDVRRLARAAQGSRRHDRLRRSRGGCVRERRPGLFPAAELRKTTLRQRP